MTGVTILAILELSSGIIAACIPRCIPILRIRRIKIERSQARAYICHPTAPRSVEASKMSVNSFTSRDVILPTAEDEDNLIPLR